LGDITLTKCFRRCQFRFKTFTRSQVVARTADCTASQHLWGSRDIIGHV